MQTLNLDKCSKEKECNIESWPRLMGNGRFLWGRELTCKECLELLKEREKGIPLYAARLRCAKILWWDRRWPVKVV